jgi:hypothetical protein
VNTGEEAFDVPDGFDRVGHVARSLACVPYAHDVLRTAVADLAARPARYAARQ